MIHQVDEPVHEPTETHSEEVPVETSTEEVPVETETGSTTSTEVPVGLHLTLLAS